MDWAGLALGYNADDVRASYIIARNNGCAGMGAASTSNVVVEHSQLRNNNTRGFNVTWHAGGIKMAAARTKGVVRDSVFDHNVGPGMWCDYCGGGDFRVQRNLFIGNTKEAQIFMEVTPNALVENNVIVDSGSRAIFIREGANGKALFNTIVRAPTGIDVFEGPRGAADTPTLLGNLILDTTTPTKIGAGITGVKNESNLSSTLATAKLASDYTLLPGSPALDQVTQMMVATDHDGSSRPKGPKSDIGAFERCE
jgi:hypothetical protein